MQTAKTLIRLGGCQGWSESSLGAHAILLGFVTRQLILCFRSLSREVLDDVQAEHRRVLKQEREARCDRVAEVLKEEFLEDTLKEQVLNLATIEIR